MIKRQPLRMCVCCRERDEQRNLMRFVVSDGEVVPDPTGRAPGRGAYVCGKPECLEAVLKKRRLGQALKAGQGEAVEKAIAALQQAKE
ncbi:MAG: YlxR family protein [Clostridiaceae bacterium]|nr:YlxR family protein [Clostridiaceae bacterium]